MTDKEPNPFDQFDDYQGQSLAVVLPPQWNADNLMLPLSGIVFVISLILFFLAFRFVVQGLVRRTIGSQVRVKIKDKAIALAFLMFAVVTFIINVVMTGLHYALARLILS